MADNDLRSRINIKTEFMIADGTNESIAWACVVRRSTGVLWLTSLWVHPDRRSKHYGAALLDAVVDEYSSEALYLEVAPYADRPLSSEQLVALYERFGFRCTDVPGVMVRAAGEHEQAQVEPAA